MIYVCPDSEEEIRQGDIFKNVPRIDFSLEEFPVVLNNGETIQTSWSDLLSSRPFEQITGIVGIRPVLAIVITQDCDVVRSPDVALCEIGDFRQVEKYAENTNKPKKWVSIITQHARKNQKWYYLPESADIGFDIKMGVDFRSVIRVGRNDLEMMRRDFRIARLNDTALAHFRERVGEFFRRYPYDEWYPLNREELDEYRKNKPEPIKPYDWQR